MIPTAEQIEDRAIHATRIGRETASRGESRIPAMSADLAPLLDGCVIGQSLPILDAFLAGFDSVRPLLAEMPAGFWDDITCK